LPLIKTNSEERENLAKTTSQNREKQRKKENPNQPKSIQEQKLHTIQSTARTPRPDKIPKSGGVAATAVAAATAASSSPLEPPVVLLVELDAPPLDVKGRELPLLHPAAELGETNCVC
jgi:hypothetical protein